MTISFTTGVTTLTTGAGQRFAKSKVGEVPGVTGVVFGPEGNVYVTTLHGELIRFPAVSTGDGLALGEPETMVANPDMQFIALAFEPGQQDTVWISQWRNDPVDAFSSEVASYRIGGGVESEVKKLVGLPRHPVGNHSVQGLPFADGKLYVSVGGMTTNGDSSFDFWGEPILRESPISASIVEVDVPSITEPLDTARFAITDNSSPIRLFATGLRNAFGLSRHSNGNLYANINQNGGTDDRNAAAPTDGPCRGLPAAIESQLIPDTFNLIRRGRYYGHPNPSRAECVVMGGGTGPFAVGGYQPGRAADPDFDESLIAFYTGATGGGFGTSVNGIDEYRGPGPLQGTLLSADFSGSRAVLVVRLGDDASRLTIDGPIQQLHDREGQVLTFLHPIDVATAVDGSVVVADFGEWSGDRIGTRGALYALSPIDD